MVRGVQRTIPTVVGLGRNIFPGSSVIELSGRRPSAEGDVQALQRFCSAPRNTAHEVRWPTTREPMTVTTETSFSTTAIRPFQIYIQEASLQDLRRRVAGARWPDRETVTDRTQGVQLAEVQKLVDYWATDYDWRKLEAKLNAFPQFISEIDGLDIHFIHVRSPQANALPLIMTHGWPGSFLEFVKVIRPLSDPESNGGRAEDAFDVIVPSMPGFGFSGRPQATGWNPERIAGTWIELMKRLGYERYVSQGGDWGAVVTDVMGRHAPPGLLGIHVTTLLGAINGHQRRACKRPSLSRSPTRSKRVNHRQRGSRPRRSSPMKRPETLPRAARVLGRFRVRARKPSATRSQTHRLAWPPGFTKSSRNGPTRTASRARSHKG